jgi:hypothetical protein
VVAVKEPFIVVAVNRKSSSPKLGEEFSPGAASTYMCSASGSLSGSVSCSSLWSRTCHTTTAPVTAAAAMPRIIQAILEAPPLVPGLPSAMVKASRT